APADGTAVVPGETFKVVVPTSDNIGWLDHVTLSDNLGPVARLGGSLAEKQLEFIYRVPPAWGGGEVNLSAVGVDANGRSFAQGIVLPVDLNEAPELNYREFASYRVNGKFEKIINQPERLNFAEFWVRPGEDFRFTSELIDDAGLSSYRIIRRN